MKLISLLLFCLPFVFCDQVTFGNVRVQTLSPTLLRVENIGPKGYEDRTTFTVTNRNFPGIPIQNVNKTNDGVVVTTQYYRVLVNQVAKPTDQCFGQQNIDVNNPTRSPNAANGLSVSDAAACCAACQKDSLCNGWIFDPTASGGSINCYPLNSWITTSSKSGRVFGCLGNGCFSIINQITVTDNSGKVLLTQQGPGQNDNMLHWPSPLSASAYLLNDFPRFYVPPWGPSPSPQPHPTNGYDFTNNQNGDVYIFLLGSDLNAWYNARSEFIKLVGPTPVLPDFAFGTWFTYWHSYSEAEAKNDISMWQKGKLPLNVYGLDMNWRNTSNNQDRYYDHPNTNLFPDFNEWFAFLKQNNLKTYFNDHPFPQDYQTYPKEIQFRWTGLTEWMEKGLDYWWFDHNWGFSIPPPNVLPVNGWDVSNTDGNWLGLDNAAWGSHIYFETVTQYYKNHGNAMRPMTLTKFARPDWRPDQPSVGHAEHPAHHRFPVWWTGDGVDLKASVQSMVDSGVHDFKPYVHSDCGGDYRGSAGDLIRWTAHCVFGSILRFHGSDHRPWTYTPATEASILTYLQIRYKLIPTLIAAGQAAQSAGYPLVARADLIWPTYQEAGDNTQYIHLNDTLVAPIWDSSNNITSRSVWVPPGNWQDAWDGSSVTGPKTITVSKPFEQIPMWHKRGGFMITIDSPALRVEEQDWSVMTLEAFPEVTDTKTIEKRSLFAQETAARTDLYMETEKNADGLGTVTFHVSEAEDGATRGWLVRLHLRPGQECISATESGSNLAVTHLLPVGPKVSYLPFRGAGTPPASQAGKIAEIQISSSNQKRVLQFTIQNKF